MYFFELIIKKLKKIKNKSKYSLEPEEKKPDSDCEGHVYLPLDSSKQYLGCKNCGKIIKTGDRNSPDK